MESGNHILTGKHLIFIQIVHADIGNMFEHKIGMVYTFFQSK